jgi:hypothetical protein
MEGNSRGVISVNPNICLERLREPRRHRSQGSQCSGKDSNRAPFDYNSERIKLSQLPIGIIADTKFSDLV